MAKKGVIWFREDIENRAKALRGKKRTPEQRMRISMAMKGRKLSSEAIQKRTETRRKNGWNKNSELTSQRMKENHKGFFGKKRTIEARLKTSEAIKGKKNHNWKGGLTPINHRIRISLEYRLWREAVLKRDDYICRFCGKRGGILQADHIKPFALFPELRFIVDNGRTLCIPCHQKTDTHGYRAIYRVQR